MPNPRYFMAATYPERLVFRNGVVLLEVVEDRDMWKRQQWVFLARKVGVEEKPLMFAWSYYHRSTLEHIMHEVGFLLVEGSPEARLMDRLVGPGYARCVRCA